MHETMHASGEALLVPERVIVAPVVGVFRPLASSDNDAGELVAEGQPIGVVEGPGTTTPVRSPFAGRLVGMLAHPGERLRQGQPVAWLRVA
jgi:biotin carboxyl carrier protein